MYLEDNELHVFPGGIEGEIFDTGGSTINVTSPTFGATGNGTTDDTVAIQAAITAADAMGGSDVFFPAGTYKISTELLLTHNSTRLLGTGYNSVIVQSTAGKGAVKNGAVGRIFRVAIQALRFDVSNGVIGGTAIDFTDISDSVLEDIFVTVDTGGVYAKGILFNSSVSGGGYRNLGYNVNVRTQTDAAAIGIDFNGSSQANGANSTRLYGGSIRADSGTGVLIRNGDQILISGVTFEGSSLQAIEIRGDSSTGEAHCVAFCRFEGVTNGILLGATSVSCMTLGNMYASGLTTKVTDSGTRNFVVEPMATAGNAFVMSRGDFKTLQGAFIFQGGATQGFQARGPSDTAGRWFAKGTSGRMGWGDGAGAEDILFNRTGTGVVQLEAGTLAMNNRFVVGAASTSPKILSGSGTPEGAQTAPVGSTYARTDGGAVTSFYVKESGVGNTGWVAK